MMPLTDVNLVRQGHQPSENPSLKTTRRCAATNPDIVLASESPRRHELLTRLELGFIVAPAFIDERTPRFIAHPERAARRLAREKAEAVARQYADIPILAADTLVVDRGEVLQKPESPDDARRMLRQLRGRWHTVISSVALLHDRRTRVRHATTRIRMRAYTDAEIDAYIERGEPFDKAGAYAIQDRLFHPVATVAGCYCNTVGLPLGLVADLLRDVRIDRRWPTCRNCPIAVESDADARAGDT